ncbi:glycosyltransferase [Ferrimonas senticii]|uniref:glycosyltransferase n=1 Tax=Ferrimonas senticii TaxID=394566 RepID=UPI00040253A0|nr:glycosyltransferase [Ferrimonas senticii]
MMKAQPQLCATNVTVGAGATRTGSVKPTMLVFGEDWHSLPSSSQHLTKALMDEFSIIWVNSIGLRQPHLGDGKRLWHKLRQVTTKAQPSCQEEAAIPQQVIAPKLWPLPQQAWLLQLNRALLKRQLQGVALDQIEYVWCALPCAVEYLPLLPNAKVIYYCGDDFAALAGVDHHKVAPLERRLLQQADLVLCASTTLQQRCEVHAKVTPQLLPHGVDLSHFSQPQPKPAGLPDKPILGFYGSLAEWIDFSLLEQLAQRFSDCQILLIGHQGQCPRSLLDRANVTLLPFMPHQQLAQYVQHFAVGLLPFKANQQIAACDPLKLREYLAAGIPVVSRPFAALQQYHVGVSQQRSVQAFADAIAAYLQQPPSAAAIQAQVQDASWRQRAEQVLQWLQIANNRQGFSSSN